MARVLSFLIRYFSNYYTLHRSDLAARAATLDPRLERDRTSVSGILRQGLSQINKDIDNIKSIVMEALQMDIILT